MFLRQTSETSQSGSCLVQNGIVNACSAPRPNEQWPFTSSVGSREHIHVTSTTHGDTVENSQHRQSGSLSTSDSIRERYFSIQANIHAEWRHFHLMRADTRMKNAIMQSSSLQISVSLGLAAHYGCMSIGRSRKESLLLVIDHECHLERRFQIHQYMKTVAFLFLRDGKDRVR